MKRLGLLLLPLSLSLLLLLAVTVAPGASAATEKGSPALPVKQVLALVELQHPRGLNRFVRAVSDPDSERYRHYASVAQLVNRFGAKPQARRRVLGWFAARGVEARVDATGTYVTATLPRRRATALLAAADGASASGAGLSPQVPVALRGAVTGVDLIEDEPVRPLVAAKTSAAKKPARPYTSLVRHSGTSTGCKAARTAGEGPGLEPFTPNQYLTAYGHAAMHKRGFKGQGQTVAVVEEGGFRRSDIATFARCFGLKPPPLKVVPVESSKPLPSENETTLDLEILSVAAPGLDRILVYEGGGGLENIIATTGSALGSPGNQPDVISISLGICEPEFATGLVLRNAFDNIFAVAAGAGISVLASAGDEGSSGCRVETETERTALPLVAVSMPASSPYVTAVGGTNLVLDRKNRIKQQVVWNDAVAGIPGGGGGGSSLLSVRTPWWQTAGRGYGIGRKVPDISALADVLPGYAFFCTAKEGCPPGEEAIRGWTTVGGTSAAAPLSAAGVALANQYAARRGQAPLGFINPLLYELGKGKKVRDGVFDDVAIGNNDIGRALPPEAGGGSPLGCCSAKPGYDWASGWGSLKVPGFSKAALRAGR